MTSNRMMYLAAIAFVSLACSTTRSHAPAPEIKDAFPERWIAPTREPKNCEQYGTLVLPGLSDTERASMVSQCLLEEEFRSYVTQRQSCSRDQDCTVVSAIGPFGCSRIPVSSSQAVNVERKQAELLKRFGDVGRYCCRPVARAVCENGWCLASS